MRNRREVEMVNIAGGIILAVIFMMVGLLLFKMMFIGFNVGWKTGCVTMTLFGVMLFGLGSCIFGG